MSAHELITEHLDLWTQAVTQKSTAGRSDASGKNGKIELTGIKKLRELILELAVRGKLIEQNSDRESAKIHLQQAANEKVRLAKSGAIKKAKKSKSITDEDGLFELPKGWEFCRLSDIGNISNGNSISKSDKEAKYSKLDVGIPYIATKDVGYGFTELNYDNGVRTPPNENFKIASPGSILLCSEGGSAGKKCGITSQDISFGNKLYALKPFAETHSRFILSFYLTPTFQHQFKERMTGIIGGISLSKFESIILPVPPVEEQQLIVQKVDELMALCDRLEQHTSDQLDAHKTLVDTLLGTLTQSANATELADNWARLTEHFDTLFTTEQSIDKLKQTILQLGMMGILTESRHDLMPVPISLETLRSQKEAISRKERIKAPKAPTESSADEAPYKLPASWLWARVGDVIALKHGYAFKSSYFSESEGPFVLTTPGNFHETGGFRDRGVKTKYYKGPVDEDFVLKAYDLIIPMTEQAPGLLGSAAFIPEDGKLYLHNQRLGKLVFSEANFDPRFVYWFFNSKLLRNELARTCSGTTVRHTSPARVASAFIPVPSVRTQKEIVKKIDELMSLCDQLKKCLNQASNTRNQLAEAVVEGALN